MTTWYRTGTVTATNGSTTVTGSLTAWLMAAKAGDAFVGPDAARYEITAVTSNTEIEIYPAYAGSTASGQSYAIERISTAWNSVSELSVTIAETAEAFQRGFAMRSTSSVEIGAGEHEFSVPPGLPILPGATLKIASALPGEADTHWIGVVVTEYEGQSLHVLAQSWKGEGDTRSSWNINIAGARGPIGAAVAVPGSTTAGNLVGWNAGDGSALKDLGPPYTLGTPIVILTSGQSNMGVGRAHSWTPPPNLRVWNFDGNTGSGGTAFVTPSNSSIRLPDAIGAEIARTYPTRTVYVIVVQVNGQPIAQWLPGASAPDVYDMIETQVPLALAAIGVSNIDQFYWWQGENNSGAYAAYPANFETLVTRLKGETWFPEATPICIYGLSSAALTGLPSFALFNEALQRCAGANPDQRVYVATGALPAAMWEGPANIHMLGPGYEQAGKMGANALSGRNGRGLLPGLSVSEDGFLRYNGQTFGVGGTRERLTASRTYYVRTDGSDSNSGLANTSGGAFLTIQKAIDTAYSLDLSIYNCTIELQSGASFTAGATRTGRHVGAGAIVISGSGGTTINRTSGQAFQFGDGAVILLTGMKIETTTSGIGIYAYGSGTQISIGSGVEFGACASGHWQIYEGAAIVFNANYAISGSAPFHGLVDRGGTAIPGLSKTITLTGTPNFSNAFVVANGGGEIITSGNTYSGAATGRRFRIDSNGTIKTGGSLNYFPGSIAGLKGAGGVYDDWLTPIQVFKTADESTASDTTMSSDSELFVGVLANGKYAVKGRIFFNTPAAADFKWQLAGPASPTLINVAKKAIGGGETAESAIAVDTAFATSTPVLGSGTTGYVEFEAILHNGANAGVVEFQWAQNTSDGGNTIVRAGSYLEYTRVG
jgi:hypothetical protein